jgi:hypothetical protein
MHAPDMVFENHTAGERAEGEEALTHIARIFESWPDVNSKHPDFTCARTWWCKSGPPGRPT